MTHTPNEMSTDMNEDRLIHLIAANEADLRDWSVFESLARADATAWERLARSLRDELQARAALDHALRETPSIEIPNEAFTPSPVAKIAPQVLSRFSGWAIAATLMLAWVGVSFFAPNQNEQRHTAGAGSRIAFESPDAAYDAYLQLGEREGRVLEELPKIMLKTRPIDGAEGESQTYEVLYVRQLLERARVNAAFRFESDELGRRVPVKVDFASLRKPSDL